MFFLISQVEQWANSKLKLNKVYKISKNICEIENVLFYCAECNKWGNNNHQHMAIDIPIDESCNNFMKRISFIAESKKSLVY